MVPARAHWSDSYADCTTLITARYKWDGQNIKEMDPVEYRKMFSVIFQDFMLYNLSAGENIRLGDIKTTDFQGKIEKSS